MAVHQKKETKIAEPQTAECGLLEERATQVRSYPVPAEKQKHFFLKA